MANTTTRTSDSHQTPVDERGDLTDAKVRGLPVLLTAKDVARVLQVPKKRVYGLGIPVVTVGDRTYRWCPDDVREYVVERRLAA